MRRYRMICRTRESVDNLSIFRMKLLPEIKDYLVKVTNAYEQCRHGPGIIHASSHELINGKPSSAVSYLLPDIIVWDPLIQFGDIFSKHFFCPKANHAANCVPLKVARWKNCVGSRDEPRKLYGKDGNVLLVSRVYVCSEGHEIIGHDPFFISNISAENVPFRLTHKSGVTTKFIDAITSSAFSGINFNEIERSIAQEYYNSFWLKEKKFKMDVEQHNGQNSDTIDRSNQPYQFPNHEEWIELPSDDIIICCFVQTFKENEIFFTKRMCDLSALYLSADHTFKVAANIGVWSQDNKWIKQYDSLFSVLNEKGQVVAWQLTKGTALHHVEGLLKALKERLDKQNGNIEAIYVDNCCQVRGKISKIFGTNIPVKLDLFHAVYRVTQKMPKRARHYMSSSCITDFANIFRMDSDKEHCRREKTPSAEKMLNNLKAFLKRWLNIKQGDGENVLTSTVLNEIECLKKHIEKGCLSDIPPGAGSEKNENMHRNLRHIIARSRLGVQSALALFTLFFYKWNEQKEKVFVKGVIPPISHYADVNTLCNPPKERFGVRSSIILSSKVKDDISMVLDSDTDITKVHGILQASGSSQTGTVDSLKTVLTKTLNFLLVKKAVTDMNNSRSFNSRLMHLMQCSLTLFSNHKYPMSRSNEESKSCLERLLSEYQLELNSQPSNMIKGDSFFFSVIASLSNLLEQLKGSKEERDEVLKRLNSMNITTNPDKVQDDIKHLRNVVSDEWKQNAAFYQKLLVSSELNFSEEADNFKKEGHFNGELGNLLALAVVRMTQICCVIFSSLEHLPIIPVVPDEAAIASGCIWIGYDVASCTYYSMKRSSLRSNNSDPHIQKTQTVVHGDTRGCNCGRGGAGNKDPERKFCRPTVGGIPSRCPCYINMNGCTHKCHCNKCDNPYGTSQNSKAIYPLTRVRHSTKLKGKKCKKDVAFLLENEVAPNLGWSTLESILFDCLVDDMIAGDVEIEANTCLAQYNAVRTIASEEGILCIGPKTVNQIQGKILNVRKCSMVFEEIYKKQIELNWFG